MTRTTRPLPLPPLYDARRAAEYGYRPDAAAVATAATAWRGQHAVKPAAADETRVHLLLIDVQKDFCFPEGSLYVAGRSGKKQRDLAREVLHDVDRWSHDGSLAPATAATASGLLRPLAGEEPGPGGDED